MAKPLTILFDLDGTLVDTNQSDFKQYRDGKQTISLEAIPVFTGAREVVRQLKKDGHQVFIVSDSHPRFVEPIARELFDVKCLSLAYKPTIDKTKQFLDQHSLRKLSNARSRIFMVGDSYLDIELARRLRIPSVHLLEGSDMDFDRWATTQKMGPTFSCKNYSELRKLLNDPLSSLLAIEGIPYSDRSARAIMIDEIDYRSSAGRRLYARALARQETGLCDRFARANCYYSFGSEKRKMNLLKEIGAATAQYIRLFSLMRRIKFDILSFVPDKVTTIPRRKMEEFAYCVEVNFPVQSLLTWDDRVDGSIRKQPHRRDRVKFVKKYMRYNGVGNLRGKNVVVVDDQYTTGATMEVISDILWRNGARDILFIALFRMIDEVKTGKKCPKCKKELSVRSRRSDGGKFYSCVPPRYGGIGCGYTENI